MLKNIVAAVLLLNFMGQGPETVEFENMEKLPFSTHKLFVCVSTK